MKNFKYKFTIFTPCYNSEKFIHRVYNSICKQTFTNFEWLVINDASTDRTKELILNYIENGDFPIKYIENSENKMLYYNFNLAFEEAEGELMIFAGHDDEFEPCTLERFNEIWEEFGSSDVAGIWCRCKDQFGNVIGKKFPKDLMISNYHRMFENYIYGFQERFACTRVDVLRQYPFDLESKRIGEGFLWSDIGLKYDTIYINDVLRTYYIEPENQNSLTQSSRKQISLHTYKYYIEFLNIYIYHVPEAYLLKLRFHFATAFYGIICGFSVGKILKDIKNIPQKSLLLFLYPFAFLTYKIIQQKL